MADRLIMATLVGCGTTAVLLCAGLALHNWPLMVAMWISMAATAVCFFGAAAATELSERRHD
jgi:hypothetical protein